MEVKDRFEVPASAQDAWDFLASPRRVAKALPATEIGRRVGNSKYLAKVSIRAGPVTVAYRGNVVFNFNPGDRTAVIRARGKGRAGFGSAKLDIFTGVRSLGPKRCEVHLTAHIVFSGLLLRAGQGVVPLVAKRFLAEFARAMVRELD